MKNLTVYLLILAAALLAGCAKKAKMDNSQAALTVPAAAGQSDGAGPGGLGEQAVGDSPAAGAGGTRAERGLAAIYFDFDSYLLSEASRQTLVHNAEWLKSRPDVKTTIEGHADERGSDEYNLALGEKRARMAMDFLHDLGVPADRMSTISYGEEKPAVEGNDESAWSRNRRVEFL